MGFTIIGGLSLPKKSVSRLTDGSPYVPLMPGYMKNRINISIMFSVALDFSFFSSTILGHN